MSHESEYLFRNFSVSINFIFTSKPSPQKQSLWSPSVSSVSFMFSSIRPLIPHHSDANSGLLKPENYPSMLQGYFDMKNSFLQISPGLPEPELSGVIFSCNVLKLDLIVMLWGGVGRYVYSPLSPVLYAINTKKVCKL